MNKISIVVGLGGLIVAVVAGIVGFWVLPDYIKRKVEEEVSLRPLSDTWEKWSNIDKPLYLSVYVLSVTNSESIGTDGAPKFEEKGPYAYRQRRRKIDLDYVEPLVSYEQETFYFFDESASGPGLSEDDPINVLNIPFYVVLLSTASLSPEFLPVMANNATFLGAEPLIRTTTLREIMFQGMNISNVVRALSIAGLPTPPAFAGGLFGLYRGNNGSTDGRYRIHSGVGDPSLFGQILSWRDHSDLHLWGPLSECDRIKGSDGTIFPPFVEKGELLHIFSSDLCRSLTFKYDSEEKVEGIKGYKFVIPREALQDPRINEANRCFCNAAQIQQCLGSGVIDVSKCRDGAPFILSTPYFLDGDEKYGEYMGPSGGGAIRALHETALTIEPVSGALLKAHKRIQINMNYQSLPGVVAMAGTNSMIFPILWVDENTRFTPANAEELKDKLLRPKSAVETWRWVGLGLGIAIILVGVGLYIWLG